MHKEKLRIPSLTWRHFKHVSFVFFLCTLIGFLGADGSRDAILKMLADTEQELQPFIESGPVTLFLFVFINNAVKSYLFMLSGHITRALPYAFVVINGLTLGLIVGLLLTMIDSTALMLGLLPHAVLEIPLILLAAALGLSVRPWLTLQKNGPRNTVNLQTQNAIYRRLIFPLLFVAAAIEVFVSMELVSRYAAF